jgi:hypothetical protein
MTIITIAGTRRTLHNGASSRTEGEDTMDPYNILVEAHSGIRYLVFLAGAVALIYAIYGIATRPAWSVTAERIAAFFVWTTRINLILGLVVWLWRLSIVGLDAMGLERGILHPLCMFAALGAMEALSARRRRTVAANGSPWQLFLIGTLVPLVLISIGVYIVT